MGSQRESVKGAAGDEIPRLILARLAGIEPATLGLEGRCSIH
jgi:hypothetical protein